MVKIGEFVYMMSKYSHDKDKLQFYEKHKDVLEGVNLFRVCIEILKQFESSEYRVKLIKYYETVIYNASRLINVLTKLTQNDRINVLTMLQSTLKKSVVRELIVIMEHFTTDAERLKVVELYDKKINYSDMPSIILMFSTDVYKAECFMYLYAGKIQLNIISNILATISSDVYRVKITRACINDIEFDNPDDLIDLLKNIQVDKQRCNIFMLLKKDIINNMHAFEVASSFREEYCKKSLEYISECGGCIPSECLKRFPDDEIKLSILYSVLALYQGVNGLCKLLECFTQNSHKLLAFKAHMRQVSNISEEDTIAYMQYINVFPLFYINDVLEALSNILITVDVFERVISTFPQDAKQHIRKAAASYNIPLIWPENSNSLAIMVSCVVCEVYKPTVMYNCGHICTCDSCTKKILMEIKKCPMCSAPITNLRRIYM